MTIASSAVLVELNISVWTANKLDRTATDNVTSTNHAVRNAAQVKKNLMAGTDMRKKIADYAAACRVWHNCKTLPWADRGSRLMPTSLFIDYKQEANVRRQMFEKMVGEFLSAYPALVQTAHNYLGDLFDANDYPSVEDIRSKFGFNLVFSPVPESGDFRLDIPAQDQEEMAKSYEEAFTTRLNEAMREPWDRLHKVLTDMSKKLTDVGDEKKRYHDTLITNATDLCDMLTHLNVTKDPELEKARRMLERAMLNADIEALKEDALERVAMKEKVDSIIKQFEW